MRKLAILAAVAPLALMSACNKPADTGTTTNSMTTDTTTFPADENMAGTTNNSMGAGGMATAAMTGQQFADAEAASGMYEIESSKLAETKASSAEVKAFARDMVKDHTAASAQLMAAAKKASPAITPSKTMTAEQQSNLDALRKASGAEFDRLYIQQQNAAHDQALQMTQDYANGGTVAPLKEWAQKTVPALQGHKSRVSTLKG